MDGSPSRRRFLRAAVPAALAALAGCSGESPEPIETDAPVPTTDATDVRATPTASPSSRTPTGTAPPETPTPYGPDSAVVEWVDEVATPLETVDPSASLSPLAAFGDALADADLVGMGEATHGTREFFRVKHRLLRYMVEELGVRAFAMEAQFAAALTVDEYVRTGEGTAEDALNALRLWPWKTEAVLSLIEWVRSFNEGRDPDDQVRFYGFDVQVGQGSADRLRSYLDTADSDALAEVGSELDTLVTQGLVGSATPALEERLAMVEAVVETLEPRFEDNREAYVAATSADEYELAKRHVWVLDRARALATAERSAGMRIRDRAMADTASWLLDRHGGGVALWAHNGHVSTADISPGVTSMGGHLRERHGDAYYALGMEFSGGRFVARKQQYGSAGTRLSMAAEAPPNGSLLDAFDATDRAPFALDFASIENGDLRDWLARDHALHVVGGATPLDAGWAEHTTEGSPTEQYDGVVFVGESSPTRPLGVDVRTPLG